MDTMTGIEPPARYVDQAQPAYVRYAESISINVTLSSVTQVLNVPSITINYATAYTDSILIDRNSRSAKIVFEMNYNQDMESFYRRAMNLFIFFMVMMLVFVIGNLFCYS